MMTVDSLIDQACVSKIIKRKIDLSNSRVFVYWTVSSVETKETMFLTGISIKKVSSTQHITLEILENRFSHGLSI